RAVAGHLDRLRASYGVALLLEAHSPYGSGGSGPRRPYGGSLWSRWPEFGLHLAESGVLSHWRGARDEREWPSALTRGGEWPWIAATSARDVLWGRIVDEANQRLSRPTVRELVVALGSSMGTIHRVLESHREEWDALFPEETK
ncbi:MAG: hypothetical protein M3N51_03605, partial [Actinomycetota bacterium]|nr:hypothetical protein [Actinomycetota bacterium]